MVRSLEVSTYFSVFYGLGALGFVAVTALPIRLWTHLRRNAWALRSNAGQCAAYLLLATAGVTAIALAASGLVHVGRCLLGFHCSANAAGGWMALGGIGFWCLAYELVAFVINRVALRQSRDAT